MSVHVLKSLMRPWRVVGSILHGAYGDYYEQMICLRHLKRLFPDVKLVLFFATESRRKELQVFDLSFADEVHSVADICNVPVEKFLQFQIRDRELNDDVLCKLPADILAKFDLTRNLKPWSFIRTIYRDAPADCDIPLSPYGVKRLPQCFEDNDLDESSFSDGFTVGFLWRYRKSGGAFSTKFQTPQEVIHRTKSELFSELVEQYGARIIVAGMNLRVTDENRERTDCKYSDRKLATPDNACTYLKGLSWGLELEIMRRCSLCLVMPSGFSEALFMKRDGPTILVDPAPSYLVRSLVNRTPFVRMGNLRNLFFCLRQPHSAERVMSYLRSEHPEFLNEVLPLAMSQ
ncbi:MAG TPA: hypothetical protein VGG44_04910 [Tepidisphaeraceae bacterium]|jgi:hypothetical protein